MGVDLCRTFQRHTRFHHRRDVCRTRRPWHREQADTGKTCTWKQALLHNFTQSFSSIVRVLLKDTPLSKQSWADLSHLHCPGTWVGLQDLCHHALCPHFTTTWGSPSGSLFNTLFKPLPLNDVLSIYFSYISHSHSFFLLVKAIDFIYDQQILYTPQPCPQP